MLRRALVWLAEPLVRWDRAKVCRAVGLWFLFDAHHAAHPLPWIFVGGLLYGVGIGLVEPRS